MIQINLLPVRQLKKRAKAKQQLGMIMLLFIASLALLAAAGMWQLGVINNLKEHQKQQEKEKQELKPFLTKLEELKKKKAETLRKKEIVTQLRDESPLTVRILDEVANKLDNKRMWLTILEQKNKTLTLEGVALDNQTIAQYMNNLTGSEFVTEVILTDSSLHVVAGRNLKRFALKCIIAYPNKNVKEEIK